jgi:hypothetical protein
MTNLKNDFIQHLKNSLKGLKDQPPEPSLDDLISENLLSPFKVELPQDILLEAQRAVTTLFDLREKKIYQDSYASELLELGVSDPGNKSIAMSYDFHVTADNRLKLIEVNTNASFLALGHEMYRMRGVPLPVRDFSMEEIRRDIETEMKLQGKTLPASFSVATIDDQPEQQRLFAEFLVYHEYFKSWGWNSKISDFRQVDLSKTDFIYNRYTDFLLKESESAALKKSFDSRSVCFSPNPYEYFLLADKQRLIDWSDKNNLGKWGISEADQKFIHEFVPRSIDIHSGTHEEIWSQRKGLFFKPKRAFGSKQSFRGSSISRKAFDEIISHEFVAQEYVIAPEKTFETPSGPQSFKYDLRCYAYQGRLQLIVARLYQGQVTNLRTPFGGFACVEFR